MKKYNTLRKMNRPIRFWGLSSLQFTIIALGGAIIVLLLVFKQVNPIVLILVIIGMVMGFVLLFSKLKEEQKKGNPNYIQGFLIIRGTPKKIVDNKNLFKNLIKTWK